MPGFPKYITPGSFAGKDISETNGYSVAISIVSQFAPASFERMSPRESVTVVPELKAAPDPAYIQPVCGSTAMVRMYFSVNSLVSVVVLWLYL